MLICPHGIDTIIIHREYHNNTNYNAWNDNDSLRLTEDGVATNINSILMLIHEIMTALPRRKQFPPMDMFRTLLLLFGIALGGLLTTLWTYLPHLNDLRPLVPKSSFLRKPTTTTTTTTTCNCNGNRQGGYWDLSHSNWVTPAENDPRCQTIQPFPCIRLQTISKNDLMPPATTQILDDQSTHNAERVVNCLTSHRRIVLMGDSVYRGLFWYSFMPLKHPFNQHRCRRFYPSSTQQW